MWHLSCHVALHHALPHSHTHTPCLVLASVSPHSLPVPAIREPFTFESGQVHCAGNSGYWCLGVNLECEWSCVRVHVCACHCSMCTYVSMYVSVHTSHICCTLFGLWIMFLRCSLSCRGKYRYCGRWCIRRHCLHILYCGHHLAEGMPENSSHSKENSKY